MQSLISFLILIICPLLIGYIFLFDDFKKFRKPLLYVSIVGTVITLLLVAIDWKFKYIILEKLFNANIYLFILIILGYGWLGFKKKKWTKTGYIFLCLIPSGLIVIIVSLLTLLSIKDTSWRHEKVVRQNYTVYRDVDSWDNMKYDISISIYKDIGWLPFLQRKIYKQSDINVELESVRYIPETNIMEITTSHGNSLSKEIFDLNQL